MPLILAIEPDRRQAAQLTGVIRHRVGAQLVLADTTERALDAIGDRVPDLVLVPALLSPQDDAALAAALRVIAAAAHVRTLTTPVLASTAKPASRGGVLAKWRRSRTKAPSQDDAGCDPAVFAEQMTAYLNEAAAERAELQATRDLSADEEVPAQELVQPAVTETAITEPVEVEPAIGTPAGDDAPVVVAQVLIEPPSLVMPVHEEVAPALEAVAEASAVVAAGDAPVFELVDRAVAAVGAEPDAAPQPPEIELWTPVSLGTNRPWPRLEGIWVKTIPVVLEPDEVPVIAQPERDLAAGQPEPAPIVVAPPEAGPLDGPSERREWVELVDSLRRDIERLRAERLQQAPVVVLAKADGVQGEMVARRPKRRTKKPKPIQDEWGFFDPEQCGFSALLAKLDEITSGGDDPEAGRPA